MAKLKWKKDQTDWWLSENGLEEIAIEKFEGQWVIVGWYGCKKTKALQNKLDVSYPSVETAKRVVEDILCCFLTKTLVKLNAKLTEKLTKNSANLSKKTKCTKTKTGKRNG